MKNIESALKAPRMTRWVEVLSNGCSSHRSRHQSVEKIYGAKLFIMTKLEKIMNPAAGVCARVLGREDTSH